MCAKAAREFACIASSRRAPCVISSAGERLPLDRGAAGAVLRAFGPRPERNLEEIRERLWHPSYGERDPETASVAVPVFGIGQQLREALALSGPRERFTPKQVEQASRILLDAAGRITSALGGDAAPFIRRRMAATERSWGAVNPSPPPPLPLKGRGDS